MKISTIRALKKQDARVHDAALAVTRLVVAAGKDVLPGKHWTDRMALLDRFFQDDRWGVTDDFRDHLLEDAKSEAERREIMAAVDLAVAVEQIETALLDDDQEEYAELIGYRLNVEELERHKQRTQAMHALALDIAGKIRDFARTLPAGDFRTGMVERVHALVTED